jgi:hypothetical protein
MDKPKVICLTPIKNESWILKKFLETTSFWADYIIIADQNSNDGSVEIAKMFPKVILINNSSSSFNEPERQKILIEEARKINGKKILIALDADESLTADSVGSLEWDIIKNLEIGTVIKFDWVNLLPQKNKYWLAPDKMSFGFVDDGSEHTGSVIHSPRVPIPKNSKEYFPKSIKVMHFQYADWERMKSKHRWYQCWEHINNPERSIIGIYRQYHHMYSIKKNKFKFIPDEWLEYYKKNGVNYGGIVSESFYYWDCEVITMLNKFGLNFFSKIDIWDVDWKDIAKKCGYNTIFIKNPRKKSEIIIFWWLKNTQYYSNSIIIKIIDRLLKILFKL